MNWIISFTILWIFISKIYSLLKIYLYDSPDIVIFVFCFVQRLILGLNSDFHTIDNTTICDIRLQRPTKGSVASEVAIEGAIIPKVERFRYLGSIIQGNGEIDDDINHRIKVGWQK